MIKNESHNKSKHKNKSCHISQNTYQAYSSKLINFPFSIITLVHLTEVNLSNNNITSIPPEINKLASLEKLYLERNMLKSLPINIIKLEKLIILALYDNPIDYVSLHPLIIRYLRMLNWGKKYLFHKLSQQETEPSLNNIIQTQKITMLNKQLDLIDLILYHKTKRSIKNMIINHNFSYLDIIEYLNSSANINCQLNIKNLIQKYGCELYCVAKIKTQKVTYYNHFDRIFVNTEIILPKNKTSGQIITFCTVLEYFFNFANNSLHKQILYHMFNSAFNTIILEDVTLNKIMFIITNILNGFDHNVDLTLSYFGA